MFRLVTVVALVSACKSDAVEREKRQEQWKRDVTQQQRARVRLESQGAEPRRLVGPVMKPGDRLAADLELTTDVEIWRASDVDHFRRHDVVHARADLVAHAVTGEEAPIDVTISKLTGDIKHADQLDKTGVIEPGVYGEPWVCVMHGSDVSAKLEAGERVAWHHEVKEWLRQVLVPLPDAPVGVGARWTVRVTDWLALEQVHATYTYTLTALDAHGATIEEQVQVSSSAGDSKGKAKLVVVPGTRSAPTGEVTVDGSAAIIDGALTHVQTVATLRIAPPR
jgi:hypothetical protein